MRPARRLCYLAWRRGVAPVCVTRGASGLPSSAPQRGPGWGRECLSCDPVPARVSIDRSEARQVASGLRVKVHPAVERLDHPDLTQELPRKLLPTRAKEAQRRRRQKRSFTRRCLWRVGCTLDLKRAHNPKVAGSNPAPATMNDEGLADASAANPFRLPRLHPGIGSEFLSWSQTPSALPRQTRPKVSTCGPNHYAGQRPGNGCVKKTDGRRRATGTAGNFLMVVAGSR
jgi:hypothetical protein